MEKWLLAYQKEKTRTEMLEPGTLCEPSQLVHRNSEMPGDLKHRVLWWQRVCREQLDAQPLCTLPGSVLTLPPHTGGRVYRPEILWPGVAQHSEACIELQEGVLFKTVLRRERKLGSMLYKYLSSTDFL